MDAEMLKISTTTDGKPPREGYEDAPAPAPIREDGQHEAYWVLSPEERAKGFVRPVRDRYRHVGVRPKYPIFELSSDQIEEYAEYGYVAFEEYPEESPESYGGARAGRYWTKAQLKSGCGSVTTMGLAIAETYARNPSYYGSTFCVECGVHLPVGEHGEFVWLDGSRVGS